jgi:AcrR family transcriptional regulator
MNDRKGQDLRIIRSKAWLLDALLELLMEKNYDDISIKELADEAGVARQTFYRNFKDIEDILLQNLDEVFDEFLTRIKNDLSKKQSLSKNLSNIASELFLTFLENKNLFIALHKTKLIQKTIDKFSDYSIIFQNMIGLDMKRQTIQDKYLTHFIAGGTYTMLNHWLTELKTVRVDEISEVYDKILKFHINSQK